MPIFGCPQAPFYKLQCYIINDIFNNILFISTDNTLQTSHMSWLEKAT